MWSKGKGLVSYISRLDALVIKKVRFGLKNRDDFCKILAWNDLEWIYAYRDILDLEYWNHLES